MATPTMHGFDISHWNTVVNEKAIPRYPIMSAKASEGQSGRDPKFSSFWAMFKRLECPYRGAYHWIRSDSSAAAQATNFINALRSVGAIVNGRLEAGAFVQLDWEVTPDGKGGELPPVPVAMVEEWCRLVSQAVGPGRIIVYSAQWVSGFASWRQRNPLFPLWYTNFNLTDPVKGGPVLCAKYRADLWQFTDKFPVPGFAAPIDGNTILATGKAVLDALTLSTPEPPPHPTDDDPSKEDALDMAAISSVLFGGHVHYFERTPAGTLGHVFDDGQGGWGTQDHGGIITGPPSAVVDADGVLVVTARGNDGDLWRRTYKGGDPEWSGWEFVAKWPTGP